MCLAAEDEETYWYQTVDGLGFYYMMVMPPFTAYLIVMQWLKDFFILPVAQKNSKYNNSNSGKDISDDLTTVTSGVLFILVLVLAFDATINQQFCAL